MKLIPEFLAGIALPRPPGRGTEDPRASSSSSSRARWAARRTTTTATARTTGRSARSCSWAAGIKGNRVIGATDEKQFARPARPADAGARQGEGHPRPARAHPRRPCASSPASPTTRSARSSRSAWPTRSGCRGSGADGADVDRRARRSPPGVLPPLPGGSGLPFASPAVIVHLPIGRALWTLARPDPGGPLPTSAWRMPLAVVLLLAATPAAWAQTYDLS